jgi:hypothetical protein
VACGLAVQAGLLAWGVSRQGRFYESPRCAAVFVVPAVLCALLAFAACLAWALRNGKEPVYLRGEEVGPFPRFVVVPFLAAVLLGFVPCQYGLPSLLHSLTASPVQETLRVERLQVISSRSGRCYSVGTRELSTSWFGRLCMTRQVFDALSVGAPLVLTGSRSWFGFERQDDAVPNAPATAPAPCKTGAPADDEPRPALTPAAPRTSPSPTPGAPARARAHAPRGA